jgi:two-component system sensor histidine kinase FlrB
MLYAENIKGMQASQSTTARFSEKLLMRLKDLESQVNDMLLFAKSGDEQIVKAMSAKDIAQASIHNVEAQFEQAGAKLNFENKANELPLLCNLSALSGAIANLLSNSLQAMTNAKSENKQASLIVNNVTVKQKDYIEFSVYDCGPGVDEADIQRIFEPFFTTKSQGTGLGLAVVQTVAKSHKGFVKCTNRKGEKGACFSIFVPASAASQSDKISSQLTFTQGVQA